MVQVLLSFTLHAGYIWAPYDDLVNKVGTRQACNCCINALTHSPLDSNSNSKFKLTFGIQVQKSNSESIYQTNIENLKSISQFKFNVQSSKHIKLYLIFQGDSSNSLWDYECIQIKNLKSISQFKFNGQSSKHIKLYLIFQGNSSNSLWDCECIIPSLSVLLPNQSLYFIFVIEWYLSYFGIWSLVMTTYLPHARHCLPQLYHMYWEFPLTMMLYLKLCCIKTTGLVKKPSCYSWPFTQDREFIAFRDEFHVGNYVMK